MAEVLGGLAETPGTPGEHEPARDDAGAAVTVLFRDHHLELVRLALLMVGDLAAALRGLPGRQLARRRHAGSGQAGGIRHRCRGRDAVAVAHGHCAQFMRSAGRS